MPAHTYYNKISTLIFPTIVKLHRKLRNHEFFHQPFRDNLPGQVLICSFLGTGVGLATVCLHLIINSFHQFLFKLPEHGHLSEGLGVSTERIMIIPVVGGIILSLVILASRHFKAREIADPIEANAIYGGRMSIIGSLRLLLMAIISNASGASIGMEAAYTQAGASFFSLAASKFRLRRQDMRILVAAGSAAAIAAAFNAPVAGAFYGFELVLGIYTVTALSQVSAAALASYLTAKIFSTGEPIFFLPLTDLVIPGRNYVFFVLVGVISATVGIFTMKSVTRCEHITKKMAHFDWLSPVLGGVLVSLIALGCPEVLGSGQGAINIYLNQHSTFMALIWMLIAKIAASAISVGSGFKGGLFSSSLFIGCLLGQAIGIVASYFLPETTGQITSFTLVGMGAAATSVVGAPITMVMLVLELTGSFAATTGVLAGILVSSAITRHYFGYSFSTWRFHVRGLPIRSAEDVGWVKDITVLKLMETGTPTINTEAGITQIKELFPPGSAKRLFVIDDEENYRGIIDLTQIYDSNNQQLKAKDLAKNENGFLLPDQDIRKTLEQFAYFEAEELPVLQSWDNHKIIGHVTESRTLRKYAHELELHNIIRYEAGNPAKNYNEKS